MHSDERGYTWSNSETATRIDYIWISEELASGLQKADIEDIEEVTESDHKIVTAEIWIRHMIAESSKAKVKRKTQSRTIYLYDKAKEENWESYAQELQKRLEIKETLRNIRRGEQEEKGKIQKINEIWDVIEEAIITAANKHIPKKKVFNTIANRRHSQKGQQQEKIIVELQRLVKHAKTKRGQKVTEADKSELNRNLKMLSKKIGARLPKIQRQWSDAWIEDIKGWQKILQEKKKKE